MVRRAIYCVVSALLLAAVVGPACARVASRYEVVQIPLSGEINGTITSITNSGIVCGYGYNIAGTPGLIRHNLNTGVTEFTDQIYSLEDVNNAGTVAGLYTARNGVKQYCVWNADGTVTDLPEVPAYTADYARINDAGKMLTGYGTSVWTADLGFRYIRTPMDYGSWVALDLNNTGSYLGRAWDNTWPGIVLPPVVRQTNPPSAQSDRDTGLIILRMQYRNAIWSGDGSYREIDKSAASWTCLNDRDQAAGTEYVGEDNHVVFWDAETGKVDVTAGMDGSFSCLGLNSAGQMLIGGPTTFADILADGRILRGSSKNYIWDTASGMCSIEDLLDPASGWRIASCSAINDQGWIAASGWNTISGVSTNIVLRPVATPEPGALISLLVGFSGLAGFAKKSRDRR